MEWVKKPQITCEADKTWNSVVRGGGRTSLTWFDEGQEHERQEYVKQMTSYSNLINPYIYISGHNAYTHSMQWLPDGVTDPNGRDGDRILGLHVKVKARVKATGWVAPEVNVYSAIGGWSAGVQWNDRGSIFAAVVRDRTGYMQGTGTIFPGSVVSTSSLMDDGQRPLPQALHQVFDPETGVGKGVVEVIAYDSWTPRRDAIRRHKPRYQTTTEGGPLPVITEAEMIITGIEESAWWEEEEHEFHFSIDLESNLEFTEALGWAQPKNDGLAIVFWGTSQPHPQSGAPEVGQVLQIQNQFTFEEVLTDAQRKRALRDRILNTQVERSTHGRQTHEEQMQEEAIAQRLDDPLNPDVAEEYMEKIEEHRGQRRERDEGDEVDEERPHSFRRTGKAKDFEVLTGMSWNDEMESTNKKRR